MRFVYSWCVVALFAPQLEGRAQDAVPIHREPRHRLVLDSVRFRVLDVQIVPGDTTRFHIHDTAILYVDLAPSPVAIQILGGAWTGFTPPGSPGGRTGPVRIDSTYVLHPITHRVTNTGASTFRVLAIISSGPAPASGGDTTQTLPGTTGSFSLADFDSGGTAVLHHHTREQADVGITGALDITIGTRVELLGPGSGVIVPSNVSHSIANTRGSVMTVIEFHTVPRPDMVPPRPAMTFPSSPVPVAVPSGRELVTQLDGSGGRSHISPTISGETCTLRWRRVLRGAPAVDVHPDSTGAELFLYIVRGDVELSSSASTRRVSAGNLIVIPAGERHVRLRSVGNGDVGIAEFMAALH